MAARAEAVARRNGAKQDAWKHLHTHYEEIRNVHLRQLFTDEPNRGVHFSVKAVGIYLDYSKNRITQEALKLLFRLAEECRLRQRKTDNIEDVILGLSALGSVCCGSAASRSAWLGGTRVLSAAEIFF